MPKKQVKTAYLKIRMAPEQLQQLEELAAIQSMLIPQYLREVISRELRMFHALQKQIIK